MRPAEKRRLRQEQEQNRRSGVRAPTPSHAAYLRSIDDNALTVAYGPAGTGKTFTAALRALELVQAPGTPYDRLILCRPAVAGGGEQHGFLPGDLKKKLEPWVYPVLDALEERLESRARLDEMIKQGTVETVPFQFLRGRTFKNACILLDEAQNTTPDQMRLFVTRLGQDSKTIVSGDVSGGQNDLRSGGGNGLSSLLRLVRKVPSLSAEVGIVEFTRQDVVRGGLCQKFVEAYEVMEQVTI